MTSRGVRGASSRRSAWIASTTARGSSGRASASRVSAERQPRREEERGAKPGRDVHDHLAGGQELDHLPDLRRPDRHAAQAADLVERALDRGRGDRLRGEGLARPILGSHRQERDEARQREAPLRGPVGHRRRGHAETPHGGVRLPVDLIQELSSPLIAASFRSAPGTAPPWRGGPGLTRSARSGTRAGRPCAPRCPRTCRPPPRSEDSSGTSTRRASPAPPRSSPATRRRRTRPGAIA